MWFSGYMMRYSLRQWGSGLCTLIQLMKNCGYLTAEESTTSWASPKNISPIVQSKSLEKDAAFNSYQANSE